MSEKEKETEIKEEVVNVEIPVEIVETEPIIEIPTGIIKDEPITEEVCIPCQEKAFVELADGICKDAETHDGLEMGKCAIPLKKLNDDEITLPEYAKEIGELLPKDQKIAYDALIEVSEEKGINIK